MKKTAIILSILVIAASAFAQSAIQMANSSTTLIQQLIGGNPTPVPLNGGKVELLWAPLGTVDPNLFNPVPNGIVNIAPVAGRFSSASALIIPAGTGFSGIAPGAIVAAIIRAWSGSYASYSAAIIANSPAGYSAIFQVDTGDQTSTPPGTPGHIVTSVPGNGFQGMTYPVPEPTVFSLGALGAATLLIFRRRTSLRPALKAG